MDRKIYAIEMASLRRCLEHLRTLDLPGMQELANRHGTDEDRALIRAVSSALATIPSPRMSL
jgi:hypothetical protein